MQAENLHVSTRRTFKFGRHHSPRKKRRKAETDLLLAAVQFLPQLRHLRRRQQPGRVANKIGLFRDLIEASEGGDSNTELKLSAELHSVFSR